MLKSIITIFGLVFAFSLNAQNKLNVIDSSKKVIKAEASCGECQFKMKGKGCHLAVRIDGKSYFVEGTNIDDHGDAHGETGFCEAIRKADVQGEVLNNKFKVTYFKLLPIKKEEPAAQQKSHH